MVATIWLLGCVLAPAQVSSRGLPPLPPKVSSRPSLPTAGTSLRNSDWVLTPSLGRGQELVYRGTFTEESTGSRVQFQRSYRCETRFFVLETPLKGVDLAAFTTLRLRESTNSSSASNKSRPVEQTPSSIRLERIQLDPQGKVTSLSDSSLAVPLDGPPTIEVGCFVEVPRGKLVVNQGWEVRETGRPVQAWRIAGSDHAGGETCLKLVAIQQSDDWERPRADRGAWRRSDTLWISPRTGLTLRLERVIEQREPARREVTQKKTLRCDLDSGLRYPHQLAQDRRAEILRTFQIRDLAKPMFSSPTKYTRQLVSLQRQIAYHVENQPPTPYREALLQVKRQVDAASRGEVVPVVHEEKPREKPIVAGLGNPAPQFIATCITEKGTARLSRWKGKPILFVFYHPDSYTATDLLRFSQDVQGTYGKYVSVVGLSVIDDAKSVMKQVDNLKLTFPILHGGGLRISYAVESTPQLIVIDAAGIVRGVYHGWGRETPTEVLGELRRWLTK